MFGLTLEKRIQKAEEAVQTAFAPPVRLLIYMTKGVWQADGEVTAPYQEQDRRAAMERGNFTEEELAAPNGGLPRELCVVTVPTGKAGPY